MNIDSILNKTIKYLFITILSITVLIVSFFVFPPVYADNSITVISVDYYSSDQNASSIRSNGILAFNTSGNSDNYNDVYALAYSLTESITGTQGVYFVYNNSVYFAHVPQYNSQDVFLPIRLRTSYGSGNSVFPSNQAAQSSYNSTYDLGVVHSTPYLSSNAQITSYNLPLYSSLDDALSEASEALSGGSSQDSFDRTITIKPGYVAYIQTDGGTLSLTATFPVYSNFVRPLWNDKVRIAFGGYYSPSSSTVFNDSFGSSIDWLKPAEAPTNILGQTKIGGRVYNAGLPDNGSCVVIYNPAYYLSGRTVDYGTVPS